MAKKKSQAVYWVVSEVAFFATLYYIQFLLSVQSNLWISSLILWLLINISIILCPVIRGCYK